MVLEIIIQKMGSDTSPLSDKYICIFVCMSVNVYSIIIGTINLGSTEPGEVYLDVRVLI